MILLLYTVLMTFDNDLEEFQIIARYSQVSVVVFRPLLLDSRSEIEKAVQ